MNSPTARHLWMLYGANEHTLRRIAAEAARRGVRPILAGADATTRPIADAYAFDHVVFDLRDPAAADEHLHGVAALCLADPPSSALRTAAIDSCLRTQTHYVDIHPGVPELETTMRRNEEAIRAGISLLPGMCSAVAPSDCLAMKLVEALPRGKSLELATGSGSDAEASFGRLLERTAARGTLRSGGKLVQVPAAHATIEAPFRDGLRTVVSVPAPGVATAYHSAGVENVVTYAAAPRATIRAMRALRPIVSALRSRPARWLTSALLERVDDSDAEPAAREQLWGRLVSEDGRVAEGTLTMPHGPTLTAAIAVEASQRAATGRTSPGAYTPAMAFGAGFITEFSGCDLRVPRSA